MVTFITQRIGQKKILFFSGKLYDKNEQDSKRILEEPLIKEVTAMLIPGTAKKWSLKSVDWDMPKITFF